MKKIVTLALTGFSTALLAACANGIPECHNNQLDGCGRGGAYTEARTALKEPSAPEPAPVVVQPPAPAPVAQPAPEPVAEPAPAPAPAPADTTIMRQADEPDLTK